jgi:hypothetical protein
MYKKGQMVVLGGKYYTVERIYEAAPEEMQERDLAYKMRVEIKEKDGVNTIDFGITI